MSSFPRSAQPPSSLRTKALVYCVDRASLPVALFSAHGAATTARHRDFDILICSLSPLPIPQELSELGIKNEVLDLRATLQAAELPTKWLPIEAYLRLWLPEALRHRYSHLLYLDADTLPNCRNLSHLFEMHMGDHPVAAALDKTQLFALDTPVLDFEKRGIDCVKYLNSGVLLIDVDCWNTKNMLARILSEKDRNPDFMFHDQSLLNLVLCGEFAELSPHWNWQIVHSFPRATRFYDPSVLHYTGLCKPWHAGQTATWYSDATIAAFQRFFAEHAPSDHFPKPETGWLRHPWPKRLDREIDQILTYPKIRRFMARYPDPWKAHHPLLPQGSTLGYPEA